MQGTPEIENTGTEDLVFLEVVPTGTYPEISAVEWLAHKPSRLFDQHSKAGEEFPNKIAKKEAVVTPSDDGARHKPQIPPLAVLGSG
jgi:oxalate decarboxylase/phosphoglucose isomerase-like protein (cupin superfamily)